ncbi:uncharacterized protein Tco025E_08813 [Trypanosoma conorhini]|uniref:Uncharacterized protein n=1 Tax=Trypanosoma conorhini TaxID=83891 RepID=A0A3S5IQI1_9TRYP|nr:uncharacterized protein Tco025E_08813 [Trypanosoma conorhini]RNF00368.1 hypothetical protein Tco025E_08813 [Trypanosoma conorhini]
MESRSRPCGRDAGGRQTRARSGSSCSCSSGGAAECGGGGDNDADAAVAAASSPARKPASLPSFRQQHAEEATAAGTRSPCCGDHDTDAAAARPATSGSGSGSGDEAEATTVTVMVPTMFTTAGGRRICVREKRRLARGSPYWRLLFECPVQGTAAPPSHADTETGLKRRKVKDDADEADLSQCGLPPAWQRRPREANALFAPSLAVFPQRPRARSCPPPVSSDCGASAESGGVTFTFPCSSFTRADGSMIYFAGARRGA